MFAVVFPFFFDQSIQYNLYVYIFLLILNIYEKDPVLLPKNELRVQYIGWRVKVQWKKKITSFCFTCCELEPAHKILSLQIKTIMYCSVVACLSKKKRFLNNKVHNDVCENQFSLLHGVCAVGVACVCSSLGKLRIAMFPPPPPPFYHLHLPANDY